MKQKIMSIVHKLYLCPTLLNYLVQLGDEILIFLVS